MLAEELLREGQLDKSLSQLQDAIRNDPANPQFRVFLFQLLSVMGDWKRALNQLNVVADLDAGALAMAQMYREAIHCEGLRHSVFAGDRSPLIFGEPEQWIALMLEAARLECQDNGAAAADLRDQAFEQAPTTSGRLTTASGGESQDSFDWIADADMRFGPLLEAVVNGRYYWIPFARIQKISIEAPADLRDFVWMPAQFTWANGGEMVGVIPTRYPGSESSDDHQIRLAQRTEWDEQAHGLGQRMLATDAGEYSLMDIREIVLDTVSPDAPSEPDAPDESAADADAGPA